MMGKETNKKIAILKSELKKNPRVTDWKIISSTVNRINFYITKSHKLENILESEATDISLTLYKRVGDKVGEVTLSITNFNNSEIKKKINEGLLICKQSLNQGYGVAPKAVEYPNVPIADPKIISSFKDKKIRQVCLNVINRVLAEFKRYNNTRLSSLELHVSIQNVNIINSKGVNVKSTGTRVHLEHIITAFKKNKEQEYFNMSTFRRLCDIKPREIVKKYSLAATHVLESKKPKKHKGKIILSNDAIKEFFTPELSANPIIMHSLARVKYMSMSKYEPGKPIASFRGDKPTIYNNPFLKFNINSSICDADGIRSKKIPVIKKGKFCNYISSKRFADYLGVEATGPLGVFEMESGPNKKTDLYKTKKEAVYEIVSFSSFVPNWVSGDFAAEIRLGYVIKNGKKQSFKGGMFVGNIFKLIEDMRLSKEKTVLPGYHGPEIVLFEKGTISGN